MSKIIPDRRTGRLRTTMGVGAVGLGLMLSGCAASGGNANASGGKSSSALQKILDRGTLNVGSCLQTPPFGILNAKGEPDGFDVDVAKELGKFLGVKVIDTDVSAAGRVPSLQSGKLDLISCTFTSTAARKLQVDFVDPPTMRTQIATVVLKTNTSIKTIEDLTGKRVSVAKGATGIIALQKANPKAIVQAYESSAAALLAVKQGQADATMDTSGPLSYAVAKDSNLKLAVGVKVGIVEDFALGVKKGEPELLNRLGEFMKEFHAKKEGTALFLKWFGIPPSSTVFDGLE